MHYEENCVPAKELYQIKQNLASRLKLMKKLNEKLLH